MKNFDWNNFSGDIIAVWCKTEEEAKDFCKQSHEHGYDWDSGDNRAEKTKWEIYKDVTCYAPHFYGSDRFYEYEGFRTLEWSEYMDKPIFTKSDLKDGDMVLRRNDVVEVVIFSLGVLSGAEGCMLLADTNEDFSDINGEEDWDIIEVRRHNHPYDCQLTCFESDLGEVVYNRERDTIPVVEMTLDEICKALGKKIKIVEG